MGPKGKHPSAGGLFQQPLIELINAKHPLARLAELLDGLMFEARWLAFFASKTGRPATPPRLVAGLLYLQHTSACSDEELVWVWAWVENPYRQHFCGETYFRHEPRIKPSSLTRRRQRVGEECEECEECVEWLLAETIEAARCGKVVKKQSFDKIIVDTTVMEKAVAYPTDGRLFERGRQHRVAAPMSPASRFGAAVRNGASRRRSGRRSTGAAPSYPPPPHEKRRPPTLLLAQGQSGRCIACSTLRRRPQPAHDPLRPAALFRLFSGWAIGERSAWCNAKPQITTAAGSMTRVVQDRLPRFARLLTAWWIAEGIGV